MELTVADVMLRLRFVGYPLVAVCGFVLGTVALGRMVCMQNGRRNLYHALTAIAFGLSWLGLWGVAGVVQYGTIVAASTLPMPVISTAFSFGIVWLAAWLTVLTVHVVIGEFRMGRVYHAD